MEPTQSTVTSPESYTKKPSFWKKLIINMGLILGGIGVYILSPFFVSGCYLPKHVTDYFICGMISRWSYIYFFIFTMSSIALFFDIFKSFISQKFKHAIILTYAVYVIFFILMIVFDVYILTPVFKNGM